MYLSQLKLKNFRNYDSLNIELHENINIFIGDNAQGKTNLLEAIYILGRGKSYKNYSNDLIMWRKEQSVVEGTVIKERIKDELKLELKKDSNINILYNEKKIQKKNLLNKNIYIVLFSPEDLKLIKEGPDHRRKFIDNELTMIKPSYGRLIKDYSKVLFQRNNLLKSIHSHTLVPDTMDIWDEQLIQLGTKIIMQRVNFLKKINDITKKIHGELTKSKEDIQLYYVSNLIKNHRDLDDLDMLYKKTLKENYRIDIQRGFTSVGPHLDDIKVSVNDYDVKLFGSQGQQRTVALSLKLSEIQLIQVEKIQNPIILLDDVMSELDTKRQEEIIRYFKDLQVFITCTELNFKNYIQNFNKKIYTIHQGKITSII
ncbi:MAG: DNA replication/repair protein RecF [Eubacteriales bacterium]